MSETSRRLTAWSVRKAALRRRVLQLAPVMRQNRIWIQGPLDNWEVAERLSHGYDDPGHIDRVVNATNSVLEGRSAFERDGLCFAEWTPEWPVLLSLLRAFSDTQERLRVLDVGGALGGTYLRAARVAEPMLDCWAVVEQTSLVDRAKSMELPPLLSFHDSLVAGLAVEPHVIIFGSVVQYLKDPRAALIQATESSAEVIALTRTPLTGAEQDFPSIEHVPARFGQMSYPMWILSHNRLKSQMSPWTTLLDDVSLGGTVQTSGGLTFQWRDVVFERTPMSREVE